MKTYTLIKILSRDHVLTEAEDRNSHVHPCANYRNTGKALAGVLNKGETIEQWKERTKK